MLWFFHKRSTVIFRSLISLSLLLTLLTVVLSAYIRLAEVGIGCEGWPTCYAQLNPETEKKGVTVLTDAGRDMAHYGARVAHRYIASALGVFILLIFLLAMRPDEKRSSGLGVPSAIFLITVFLSLLGYYTPTRSNPLITMGNLLGGMSLLGLLWWLMQREAAADGLSLPTTSALGDRPLARLALVLVLVQVVLGGWSSANYASANCPGLLSCQGGLAVLASPGDVFNPARTIELDATGQVLREDALGLLSLAHRFFALLTAAYLAWLVRRLRPEQSLHGTVLAMSVFSIGQIVVGVSSVWFEVPLLLLTLHNALAAGLLLSAINLLHRLTPPTGSQPPG